MGCMIIEKCAVNLQRASGQLFHGAGRRNFMAIALNLATVIQMLNDETWRGGAFDGAVIFVETNQRRK